MRWVVIFKVTSTTPSSPPQIGLGREEAFRINLALKQLAMDEPIISVRFWGKVFGTKANYIIADAEYQEGEGEGEDEKEENREEESAEGGDDEAELDNESSENEKDEPPKSQWKPPPVVPKEEPKTGANKKSYFVCNNRKTFTVEPSNVDCLDWPK